jgi:hypothetical protein
MARPLSIIPNGDWFRPELLDLQVAFPHEEVNHYFPSSQGLRGIYVHLMAVVRPPKWGIISNTEY